MSMVAISQFTVGRRGCYLGQLLMIVIASSDRRGRIQGGKTAAERQRRGSVEADGHHGHVVVGVAGPVAVR